MTSCAQSAHRKCAWPLVGLGLLWWFDQGKRVADDGAYRWPKGVLSEMREDRHGQVWLGIYGSGLFCYATNGAVLNLSRTEGLPGNFVRSLQEDREGNIWAGTEGAGLARIKPALFRSYGREQGLASDPVGALRFRPRPADRASA